MTQDTIYSFSLLSSPSSKEVSLHIYALDSLMDLQIIFILFQTNWCREHIVPQIWDSESELTAP